MPKTRASAKASQEKVADPEAPSTSTNNDTFCSIKLRPKDENGVPTAIPIKIPTNSIHLQSEYCLSTLPCSIPYSTIVIKDRDGHKRKKIKADCQRPFQTATMVPQPFSLLCPSADCDCLELNLIDIIKLTNYETVA